MPSHNHSHFQPPPPIRTSTSDSQKSMGSGPQSPASDMASPTAGSFHRGQAASPTEESFFGAIAGRMRRGRSRSRSRDASSRSRSKSPLVLPPEHFPSPANRQSTVPTYPTQQPRQPRHASSASQSSTNEAKPTRPSLQGPSRRSTSGSSPWHGRHSNDWLFNGFSVTETAKDILNIGRKA